LQDQDNAGMNVSDGTRIQRFESQFRDFLEEVLRGVPLDSLSEPAIPGKWSALENLAHLGRYHEVFQERLDQMLQTKSPLLPRYRAEDDPLWETWRTLSASEVLAKVSSLRQQLLARLKTLQADDFLRVGVHPKFGEMTLSLWLEFFLVHEGHHLYVVLQQVRRQSAFPKSRD
jgi:hypothetical protein